MIIAEKPPYVSQEWPIVGWDGPIPRRARELHLKVGVEISYTSDESEVVNDFIKAYAALMEKAVHRKTGNPVILKKVAKMDAADGSFSMVQPADRIPRGMLKGIEDERDQNQVAGEQGSARQEPRQDLWEEEAREAGQDHVRVQERLDSKEGS